MLTARHRPFTSVGTTMTNHKRWSLKSTSQQARSEGGGGSSGSIEPPPPAVHIIMYGIHVTVEVLEVNCRTFLLKYTTGFAPK